MPSSTPWLIPRSPYLPRHRVMVVFEFSSPTPSISPMLEIFEKSLDWKGERSFYLPHSVDRTWLISLKIAKWSKCIHRWRDPPILRLPIKTTICSPRWSYTISPPSTVDWWRPSANHDIPIRLIDVPIPRYGRQYYAIERRIRTPVDDKKHVWSSAFLDSTDEPVQYDRSVG